MLLQYAASTQMVRHHKGPLSIGMGIFYFRRTSEFAETLFDENWKNGMDTKFSALLKINTRHLVPPANGQNIIDCKLVYMSKRKVDGC